MAQRIVSPEPIRARIVELKLSEAEVARRIGITRNKLWLSLKGERDFSFQEAATLAKTLGMRFDEVLQAFGIEYADPDQYLLRVHGYLRDNDQIELLSLEGGVEEIPSPFSGWFGLVFRVKTSTLPPGTFRAKSSACIAR